MVKITIGKTDWEKEIEALNSIKEFLDWFRNHWVGKKLTEENRHLMTLQVMYFEDLARDRKWIQASE